MAVNRCATGAPRAHRTGPKRRGGGGVLSGLAARAVSRSTINTHFYCTRAHARPQLALVLGVSAAVFALGAAAPSQSTTSTGRSRPSVRVDRARHPRSVHLRPRDGADSLAAEGETEVRSRGAPATSRSRARRTKLGDAAPSAHARATSCEHERGAAEVKRVQQPDAAEQCVRACAARALQNCRASPSWRTAASATSASSRSPCVYLIAQP